MVVVFRRIIMSLSWKVQIGFLFVLPILFNIWVGDHPLQHFITIMEHRRAVPFWRDKLHRLIRWSYWGVRIALFPHFLVDKLWIPYFCSSYNIWGLLLGYIIMTLLAFCFLDIVNIDKIDHYIESTFVTRYGVLGDKIKYPFIGREKQTPPSGKT